MDPRLVKVIGLIALGAVALIGAASRALTGPRAQARRRMRLAPDRLAEGEAVTLTGVVRELAPLLEAPLSGKPCVAFESHLRFWGKRRDLLAHASKTRLASFVLDTPRGSVIVEGDKAELHVPATSLIPRKLEREIEFATDCGAPTHGIREASAEEIFVAVGARIAVHGVIHLETDPQASADYREAGKRVLLRGHSKHPLTIAAP